MHHARRQDPRIPAVVNIPILINRIILGLRTSKDPVMSKVWLVDMARRDAELETARRSIRVLVEESMFKFILVPIRV